MKVSVETQIIKRNGEYAPHITMKTNKDKLEKGSKQRAGTLLSSFIRVILQEETPYMDATATEDTDVKMMTKAEAVARTIIDRALGNFTYYDQKTESWKIPAPDKSMIELIYDRTEGKVGTFEDEKKKQADIPDKISRVKKQHLNKLALESVNVKRIPD